MRVGLMPTGAPGTVSILGDTFSGRVMELLGGVPAAPEKKESK